jgi:hypothetical protein
VLTDAQRQRVDQLRRQEFRGRMGPAGRRGWSRGYRPGARASMAPGWRGRGPGGGTAWRRSAPAPSMGPRWHHSHGSSHRRWDMRRGARPGWQRGR